MAQIPTLPKGGKNLSARQKFKLAKKAINAERFAVKQNRMVANARADAFKSSMKSIGGTVATSITTSAAAKAKQADLNEVKKGLDAYKAIINGGAGDNKDTDSITEVGGDGANATKNKLPGSAINK